MEADGGYSRLRVMMMGWVWLRRHGQKIRRGFPGSSNGLLLLEAKSRPVSKPNEDRSDNHELAHHVPRRKGGIHTPDGSEGIAFPSCLLGGTRHRTVLVACS